MPDITPEQVNAIDTAMMNLLSSIADVEQMAPALQEDVATAQQILEGLKQKAQGPEYDDAGGPA